MAKNKNLDYSSRRGKLNKKSNVIHRIRNGKEHVYSILNPNTEPPSEAQKSHRALFGKVNAVVNRIMADPRQVEQWTARMAEANRHIKPHQPPYPKRFVTTRQYLFSVIREQLTSNDTPFAEETICLPPGISLQIKPFAELSASDLYEILKARFNVFYLSQRIHYPDMDNIDYLATHLSLLSNGQVVAYARLFPDAKPSVMRLGRMLATPRRKGLGSCLMMHVIAEARRQGANILRLHAQTQAVPFYERFGFQPVGDIFAEANIPHLCMELTL